MLSIGLVFWICMLLILVFGVGWVWDWNNRPLWGHNFLLWLLLFLLGWGVFGFPISGK